MNPTTIRRDPPRLVQGRFQDGRPRFRTAVHSVVCQPKARGHGFAVPPGVDLSTTSAGQPLPPAVLQKMEQIFGTRFADVRAHVGPQAASIGALAFTMGSHIYFAPGQYEPHSARGQRLLSHELAHVVQQRSGRVRHPFGTGIAIVQDPGLEAEAERMGLRAGLSPPRQEPQHPAAKRPTLAQPKARGTVQTTKDSALDLARRLGQYQYASFRDALKDKYRFSEGQWREIVAEYNKDNKGVRLRFVYDKPQAREETESSGPRLSKTETKLLIDIKTKLAESPKHESFLYDLEMRARDKMGMLGFVELYRGGHIVFNDKGAVYLELTKKHGGLMKARYTTKKQTSHYTKSAGYDVSIEDKAPQMGVDFPSPLTGHILIGIVPEKEKGKDANSGNTFVQTEMYGFQTPYNHYVGHAFGFVANVTLSLQSGMVGNSQRSEKSGSELKEQSTNQ